MKQLTILFFSFLLFISCESKKEDSNDFTILFEKSNGTETATYSEVIEFYENLAASYPQINLIVMGETDSGYPLHIVVYNPDGKITVDEIKTSNKNRVLINNGIHPGESDGIDASMMMLRDIVQNDSLQKNYENSLIAVIPVYNIGGALNRNSTTRANQNGPKEYGFRGNTRNYDLNRDFVKQDTKNSASFAKIFHLVNPDVFIDNHVSNGADYQYAITHLFTQYNKLGGDLGQFLEYEIRPDLERRLQKKKIDITPYVNVWGRTPREGWSQFFDSPRYSTGYSTLFNSLGMMVETHMLKPYKIRVEQTYELMLSMLDIAEAKSKEIKELRSREIQKYKEGKTYPLHYVVDRENPSEFVFKGYEGEYIDSKVTSGKRLFYDKSKPYEDTVKYYNKYIATKEVRVPEAYILKKGWHRILDRLKYNNINFTEISKDTIVEVETIRIGNYATRNSAYEGHYLHYNTSVVYKKEKVVLKEGDLWIPTNQEGIRYIIETLEPEAVDSFFNWNFFDTVLQRKEGFSTYVFDDVAYQLIQTDSVLKEKFEHKKQSDTNFAKNTYSQLNFIYENSPNYENTHLQIPVYKTIN